MNIKFANKMVYTEELPKNPKKITGTRFAAILGVNPYCTPFKCWCEITKVYEEKFEDTIYTQAGKDIEPLQAGYVRDQYMLNHLVTPYDRFGADYFNKTRGDFFKDKKIFGGMWDYLFEDDEDNVTTVLEMKTTKRVEDWKKEPPIYYQLQAALYAYLLGVDDVMMVGTFLNEEDYDRTKEFHCTPKNTIIYRFSLKEKFPNFQELIDYATDWYNKYVLTGESPDYDETKDADVLKQLKSMFLAPDTNMQEILAEADALQDEIDEIERSIEEKVERLENIKNIIKQYCMEHLEIGKTSATIAGKTNEWKVSVLTSRGIDKEALAKDGLLDKYNTKLTTTYKLTRKDI